MEKKGLFVGPAGWSYPDWKGCVYRDPEVRDPLVFITSFFDAVEINSTFYRIPTEKSVRSWITRVIHNKMFSFTVKLHRLFTHEHQNLTEKDITAMKKVSDMIEEAGLLGALLAQFPYRFHQDKEHRQYLLKLRHVFSDKRLVVEFRHRSWFHKSLVNFLRDLRITFCNIDQPQLSYSLPLSSIVTTSDLAYLRCHGRNVSSWFKKNSNRDDRYYYRYSHEELKELVAVTERLMQEAERVFVIFNNHFQGNEVFDAVRFIKMLGFVEKKWPEWWPLEV